jgi:hypothetical protein
VHGAGADDNEETVILAADHGLNLATAVDDGLRAAESEGELLGKDLGRDKRADVLDATVVEDVGGVADRCGSEVTVPRHFFRFWMKKS